MAFLSAAKGACILSDDESAEVGICNMDSSHAKALWNNNSALHPTRPMVVISINDPLLDNSIYVAKPINITTLIESIKLAHVSATQQALSKASNAPTTQTQQFHTSSGTAHTTSKQNNKKPTEEPQAPDSQWKDDSDTIIGYYSPGDFLQGKLEEILSLAHHKKTAMRLSIKIKGKWASITADPGHNKVISELSNEELESLCTTPIYCIDIKSKFISNNAYFSEPGESNHLFEDSTEQFLWKIALWTSAGRLPQGMTPSHQIKLKHWPNLTRLTQSPNDIRISALLTDQPSAPALIAKVLGIPITQVFSYYAASHALGLAVPAQKAPGKRSSFNIPPKSKHHSLLGRIINKFSNPN